MHIAYTSDLHGNLLWYRQLLDLAAAQPDQLAIVGGDLLPHATQRATAIEQQRRFVVDQLAPLLRDYTTRLPKLRLLVIPGNDDWAAAIRALDDLERAGLLVNLHGRAVQLDRSTWIAGSGLVNLTPFAIKDWERRDTLDAPPVNFGQALRSDRGAIEPLDRADLLARPLLSAELAQLATLSDPQRTIYVLHAPPFQTLLDQRTGGRAIGSRAVRDLIRQHQPPLTLHGHVHESPTVSGAWLDQLGTTVAINPGQAQRGFHAVTLDTSDPIGSARHTLYDPDD